MDGQLLSVLILLISILVLACLAGTLLTLSGHGAQMAKLVASQRATVERLPPPGVVARLQQELRASLGSQRNGVVRPTDATTGSAGTIDPLVRQMEELASRSTEAIGMLSQELAMSHRHFQAAVMTLSEPRQLQDWAETLRGAVRPLQEVDSSIRQHDQTTRQMLEISCRLLEKSSVQRDSIAASYAGISDLLNSLVTSADRLSSAVDQSACLQSTVLECQKDVAQAQERTTLDLERRQSELGTALGDLTARVGFGLASVEEDLKSTVLRCSQLLQESHQRQVELIGQASQFQAKNQRAFQDALSRNHALWEAAARSMQKLPTAHQGEAMTRLVYILIGIQGVTALASIACAIHAFAPGP